MILKNKLPFVTIILFMIVSQVFSRVINDNHNPEIVKRGGLLGVLFDSGSTKSSISDIYDAISHYRGKSGNEVPANQNLVKEMKSDKTYKDLITNLKSDIRKQITATKIQQGIKIQNPAELNKLLKCTTLGSYYANISYSFIPKNGNNSVRVNFMGSDRWDFDWNSGYNFWQNLFKEEIPSWIAGDGEPFNITFDFYDDITVTY